jgi:hypothetical protein
MEKDRHVNLLDTMCWDDSAKETVACAVSGIAIMKKACYGAECGKAKAKVRILMPAIANIPTP